MKRYLHHFDKVFIALIAKLPLSFRPLMLFGTLIGQPPISIGIALIVIGYGLIETDHLFVTSGIIALLTILTSSILKLALRRARPDNDYVKSMLVQTFSFPSGHAAGTLVSFGLLVVLYSQSFGVWAMPITLATATLCAIVGVSRVYLGAHYPSDVIGGWIVGGLGLLAIMAVSI